MSEVLREEDNHVIVKMPNGEVTMYCGEKIVPLKYFKSEMVAEIHTEPALELDLRNSWGPVLDVRNIGLDNIYQKLSISPATFAHICDGTLMIQKAGDNIVFQIKTSESNIWSYYKDGQRRHSKPSPTVRLYARHSANAEKRDKDFFKDSNR